MKTLIILLGLLAAVPASASDLASLAAKIASTGADLGVQRFSMEEFAAGAGATGKEAAVIKAAFAQELSGQPGAAVMDAAMLKALSRAKGWPQAVVRGSVFGSGASRILVVKVTSVAGSLGVFQLALAAGQAPPDLRDAPGAAAYCEKRGRALDRQNRLLVDLKARYWAARVREPGFDHRAIGTPPGHELREYPVRQRFYALINTYYEQDGPVTVSRAEKARLEIFMKKEAKYSAECASARKR